MLLPRLTSRCSLWVLQHLRAAGHLHQLCGNSTFAPVLIAGAGPTGLVLSSLLSLYGVEHLILEQRMQLTQHPQAHFINNRTMEVFRALGPLAAQVAAASPPLSEWRKFVYCESMLGQVIGEVDHFPGQSSPRVPSLSPEGVAHLSQHKLLPLLLEQAADPTCSLGEVLWGRQVQSLEFTAAAAAKQAPGTTAEGDSHHHRHSDSGGSTSSTSSSTSSTSSKLDGPAPAVLVNALNRASGAVEQYGCEYLVAADGAHSVIRQLLGIGMSGEPAMQHLINIHFRCPGLGQQLLQQRRPGMLYFVFNREVVAVVVAHSLQEGDFVAQVPYFPPQQSPEDFTEAVCQQLVVAAAGAAGLQADILTIKPWVMSAQVADRFSAGPVTAQVLLAGDAAHRFPPAGGFGMNTGIQDAHNLGWKLAAVLKGTASPALLASYEQERRPVALANTTLSVANWQEAVRVPAALGLSPGAAQLLHKAASAAPLPGALSKALLEAGLAAGRALASFALPFSQAQVQQILQAGDSLRLQFPREDLGFRYTEGALQPPSCWQVLPGGQRGTIHGSSSDGGGTSSSRESSSGSGSGGSDRNAPYVPSSAEGCRLPHIPLLLLLEEGGTREVSSLDFVTPQHGLKWLLVACSMADSSSSSRLGCSIWLDAGRQLQQQGWPVHILHILPPSTAEASQQQPGAAAAEGNADAGPSRGAPAAAAAERGSMRSAAAAATRPGLQQAVDASGAWQLLHAGAGLPPGVAEVVLLVRPDGHVAWRGLGARAVGSRHVGMEAALGRGNTAADTPAEETEVAFGVQVLSRVLSGCHAAR